MNHKYQIFYNVPHIRYEDDNDDLEASSERMQVSCVIYKNETLVDGSESFSYVRSADNIYSDNCSASVIIDWNANDEVSIRCKRNDDSSLDIKTLLGRFFIIKV